MKKFLVLAIGVVLVLAGNLPAQSNVSLVAFQKTLTPFFGSSTSLSSAQKAEVKRAVEDNPFAEKFICTGIRYFSQPMSVNIMVRKRAKEACAYAKELNPKLSTWYQNKPTQARSYAGKVLLTIKSPETAPIAGGYLRTDPIDWAINPDYQEGKNCGGNQGNQLIGLDRSGNPAFVQCTNPSGGVYKVDRKMPRIDKKTMRPLIPIEVPSATYFGISNNLYIEPVVSSESPRAKISQEGFDSYSQCKVSEVDDGSVDKSYGFPLPPQRVDLVSDFKILVVPIQFTDHRATSNPAADMADVVHGLTKFYETASANSISIDWTIPESYYQMGVSIDSFKLSDWSMSSPGGFYYRYEPYIEAALAKADADYNFNEFDVVIVEEPRSVTNAEHPMYVPHAQENGGVKMDTSDGLVRSLLITGNDEQRSIPNWIHEFGHLLGLPDRNWQTSGVASFDVMWGSYSFPELSVWSRWQLEILKDKQIDCKTDKESSTHWLRPVEWVGDYKKGIVIPVSSNEVIVIESRRRQGFDALLGKESEGAYIYRIDTSAKMYQPDTKEGVDIIAPPRHTVIMDRWSFDAPLKTGESVISDGWEISVIESGAFGDVVQVRPASG